MQAQYETAWSNAEATHAQGRQLLDSLTKVSCSGQHLMLTNHKRIPHGSWDSLSPDDGLVCRVSVTLQPHVQNKSSSFFTHRRHISACCSGWHEGVGKRSCTFLSCSQAGLERSKGDVIAEASTPHFTSTHGGFLCHNSLRDIGHICGDYAGTLSQGRGAEQARAAAEGHC